MRNVSFTVDFWHIKVKDLIGGVAATSTAVSAVLRQQRRREHSGHHRASGQPDTAFPNALPLLGFIQSSFVNQDQQVVSGLDFGINISTAGRRQHPRCGASPRRRG